MVKLLVEFIYFDTVRENDVSWDLFEAAKMYDLSQLQNLCLDAFRKKLSVANCCAMLEGAFKHDLSELFDRAVDFLNKNKWDVAQTKDWEAVAENSKLITKIYMST